MKKKSTPSQSGPARRSLGEGGFLAPRVLVAVLLWMAVACSIFAATLPTVTGKLAFLRRETPAKVSQRTLTFAQRVSYQRALEEVYWRHRIWPRSRGENPDPKPSLDAVITQAQVEKKVADYLDKSQTLQDKHQPITATELQAEMDRMAQRTKQPEMLHELFEALGNDPFVIAECLARPVLVERLLINWPSYGQIIHRELIQNSEADLHAHPMVVAWNNELPSVMAAQSGKYTLPEIPDTGECINNTWTATSITNAPAGRFSHTAVWTGTEMIVWGGGYDNTNLNTGGRYNPATDSWAATSTTNAPYARSGHTAVWTGNEMIVWGGHGDNTGGTYNPATNNWTATSTNNAPPGRSGHTAVWTGSEMIVWGGVDAFGFALDTGGKYNPGTNSWTPTSSTNPPSARIMHTAVWTGTEMIVWGGWDGLSSILNTGRRYNPRTDSWTATSITNAPSRRAQHTAVWTGSEMIVWGGARLDGTPPFNTGGRYNPGTNSWTATSITHAPSGRNRHTAAWTGTEMIVWGGSSTSGLTDTGGRYDPRTASWTAISTANAPAPRVDATAVWTGNQMLVWGGWETYPNGLNTGGRYCAPFTGSQLGNISTRAFVQTGDNVVIGGFIIQGAQTKRVIIRAIGPELGAPPYNIPNALANPTLELHDGTGALIASNDNWVTTIIGGIITTNQVRDIMNSGHAPGDGRESAIIADLAPGNYTAIVRGVDNMTGVALVEVYDLSGDASSILGNISTRSFVQTGDNVMIGGFIVQGSEPKRVIIRGIGPELGAPPYNVPNALADPSLELHNGTGALIGSNDNWQHTIIGGIITTDQVQDIIHSGYAPGDPRESAIIAHLPPGNYTAIVRGVNNTIGVALVEVYDLH
jgi:N-acetylneuraminic acid mutarotase